MNKYIELLRSMSQRTGMYFGKSSFATISHLELFFQGTQVGQRLAAEDFKVLDAFDDWVCWRYRVPGYSLSGLGHILKRANDDQEAAFRLFFQYLEEYLLEREKLGPEGIKTALLASYEIH